MKKNGLVEGTFIATLAIVFSKFLGIIYVIPFYDLIGEKGGALYAYSYNIYLLFLGLTTAGLPVAISKLVSEYNTLEMHEAKERTYRLARNVTLIISVISFLLLFVFAEEFSYLLIGNLKGGNTIEDVALTVRAVSFCLLIAPFISILRGYMQGHKFISAPSMSQVIEQIVRIAIILIGSYLVIKVFKGTVTLAVSISVFAAFVAGVAAYIYLKIIITKNKDSIKKVNKKNKDKIETKEIIVKIIEYSIPLIIVAIAINVYNIIDMALVNRGMYALGYSASDAETISSTIATWAPKICMIVGALATGLSAALIPHMTSSFVKKDMKQVNEQFNKALQMTLVITVPTSIGLCILARPVFTLFFGASTYGPTILSLSIFVTALSNVHIVALMGLQSLNKYKTVYIATFTGFILNALLDLPFMYAFDKIGIPPYLGALTASITGYLVTIIIGLMSAKVSLGLNYKSTEKIITKMILPTILMITVLLIINHFLPMNSMSVMTRIGIIAIDTIVGAIIYLSILFKNGVIIEVFGQEMIDKILKTIKLKK